jgi:hypothetical protein
MCINGIFLHKNSNYALGTNPLPLPACNNKKQGPVGGFNPVASPAWKACPEVFVLSFAL